MFLFTVRHNKLCFATAAWNYSAENLLKWQKKNYLQRFGTFVVFVFKMWGTVMHTNGVATLTLWYWANFSLKYGGEVTQPCKGAAAGGVAIQANVTPGISFFFENCTQYSAFLVIWSERCYEIWGYVSRLDTKAFFGGQTTSFIFIVSMGIRYGLRCPSIITSSQKYRWQANICRRLWTTQHDPTLEPPCQDSPPATP